MMNAGKKENLRFILACVFTCVFELFSFLMVNMASEAVVWGNVVPSDGISSFFGFLYGTLFYITVPLFGMGILSVGLLAIFFAHSLRSHENPKVVKIIKILCFFNGCFLALDILSLAIVLL